MADTFPRTIAGRKIAFRAPTKAQLLMVGRLMRTSRSFTDSEQTPDMETVKVGVEKFSILLDIIDSMVIDTADRDWLEGELIAGRLDLEELMSAFDVDDEESAKPVKKVAAKKAARAARSQR